MFYSLHINFPPNKPFATMLTVSCALHYCTHSLLFSLKYSLNHNSGSRYPMLVGFLCLSTPFGDSSYPSRVVSIKSCKGLAVRLHSTIETRLILTMQRKAKPPPYHFSPTWPSALAHNLARNRPWTTMAHARIRLLNMSESNAQVYSEYSYNDSFVYFRGHSESGDGWRSCRK